MNVKDIIAGLHKMFRHEDNDEAAKIIRDQARIARECAAMLQKTNGLETKPIIDFEHAGDKLEQRLGAVLDTAFILRFDKSDLTKLSFELDDVVDRMRKVVEHISIHCLVFASDGGKQLLNSKSVQRMFQIIVEMSAIVETLTAKLALPHLPLDEITAADLQLEGLESEADTIRVKTETELASSAYNDSETVQEYIEYTVKSELLKLLERVTDASNHCGSLVQSLARKVA